jgi:hypothetical protein
VKPAGGADERTVTDLAQARLEAAREVEKSLLARIDAGNLTPNAIGQWSPHLLQAELEVAKSRAERIKALEAHVERLRKAEGFAKAARDAGRYTGDEYAKAKFYLLDAELQLAKEKAKR